MSLLRAVSENWRNKVVALFFAVSIWFVAFQSETRTHIEPIGVDLQPLDPSETVILETRTENRQLERVPFTGLVEVTFSGPRKEIELLEQRLQRKQTIHVPRERERHVFSADDFDVPLGGASIVKIEPPWVELRQEKVETVVIDDLKSKVQLSPSLPGYDISYKEVTKPQSLTLRVPASLKDKLTVKITVPWPSYEEEIERLSRFGKLFALEVVSPEPELVNRTVKIYDPESNRWVGPLNPPRAHVRVRMSERNEVFSQDAVKVTFRLPPMPHPFRIVLHDVPGATIPLEFSGPAERIDLLKRRFREQPGFAVTATPPANFDPERGGTFTFTEDALELPGFPDVQIRQHEARRKELKTAWSYEVKVSPELGRGEGASSP